MGLHAFIYALPSRNPDRKEQLSGASQSGAHHLPRPTHAPRQVLPAPWDPPPDLSLPPPACRGQAGPVTTSLKSRRGRANHCVRHVCTQVASLPRGTRHEQLLSPGPVGQLGSSAGQLCWSALGVGPLAPRCLELGRVTLLIVAGLSHTSGGPARGAGKSREEKR